MSRIVVLGAGPAGLIAALEAAEAGHEVTVFEASDHVGGMSASFTVDGQRVDFGSHRLHPATDPEHMERLRSILGADLQARERNGRIWLRDRWVGFPLRAVDMARSLPVDFSVRVARDAAVGPLRRGSGASFAGAITKRLGPTVFREFYEPYARKLYGLEPHLLDAELADRRVAATSPLHILRKVVSASTSDGRRFYYPRDGYGQIADQLADAATEAGAQIRLNSSVDKIGSGGRSVTAAGHPQPCDLVLSTVPVPVMAHALDQPVPAEVASALAGLRTRAMVLVYLTVDAPQFTPFDAHYFPAAELRISRLSEPKNYRNGADPADTTVLCGEFPCWPRDDDPLWVAGDDELGTIMRQELAHVGLPVPSGVSVTVRRLRSVYPVYEPSSAQDRALVDRWLGGLDGIVSLGRQGLWAPDNLHHVLAMGSAAVAAIDSAGQFDRARWQRSLREFTTHVVQD